MKSFRGTLICVTTFFCLLAHAADPGSILIRNATLIDRIGAADDVIVSVLIKDGKLNLITKDRVSSSEAELVIDAENRVLIGNLALNEVASFILLEEDPRENFKVLRDTAAYIKLAVEDGVVVTNTMPAALVEGEVEVEGASWLAYSAPPFALPVNYHDNRKFNSFETGPISGLFTGALAVDRQRWLTQDAQSVDQVGDLTESDGGEIRALRFGLVGTLNFDNPWVYVIAGATNGFDKGFETDTVDDFTWFDYRLDIPVFEKTTLSIGKQKEPISMERGTGMVFLPFQERSATADAMMPGRNHGIVLSGTSLEERMSWAGGVFNNWIDSPVSFEETPNQYVGRVTTVAWSSKDESNLFHLGFGLRHTDAKLGLRYHTEPEFNQSPTFVDTDLFSANSSMLYDVEASWRKGPYWLNFEYVYNDVDSPEFGDPSFNGYNLTASWVLSGEMRSYDRKSGTFRAVPVSKSVYQGGWGAWELAARWSELDLTDGSIEGGETEILSLGVNWWLTPTFQASINYRSIGLDQSGLSGRSSGMNARILLIFE
jgi:phosphate-selective porin OprO/OprP